jgi:hypothetical protein
MNQIIRWHRAIAAHLALVLLLSLVLVSTGTAAWKPNRNNNNQQKWAAQAAAQARNLERQIHGLDKKITTAQQALAAKQSHMNYAANQQQQARSVNEEAKLLMTSAKREREEVEDAVLDGVPSLLVHKSAVEKAKEQYEAARNKAEAQIPSYVKGTEKEKRITAVPAVQQAQQALIRVIKLAKEERQKYLNTSPSWIGSVGRLNVGKGKAEDLQKDLNQKVSVFRKSRAARDKAQRDLNRLRSQRNVLDAHMKYAERVARHLGYQGQITGSGSYRSPGDGGR